MVGEWLWLWAYWYGCVVYCCFLGIFFVDGLLLRFVGLFGGLCLRCGFVGLCVGCSVLHASLVFGFVVRCFCCFDFGVRLLCLVVALLFSVLGLRCCVTGGMCVCSVGWVCFVSCVEAGAFVRWGGCGLRFADSSGLGMFGR